MGYFDLTGLLEGWENNFGALIIILVSTLSIFYAILYAIAKAFNLPQLLALVKREFMELFATVLLVVFLISFIDMASGIYNSMNVDTSSTLGPLDLVKQSLQQRAIILSDAHRAILTSAKNPFRTFSEYVYLLGLPIRCYGGSCSSGGDENLYNLVESYRFLYAEIIPTFLIALNAYLFALYFVKDTMLSFYLPIGIFLRAIPPTRYLGAFIIAMAITLYFVFPFIFILSDPGFPSTFNFPDIQTPNLDGYFMLCYPQLSPTAGLEFYNPSTGSYLSLAPLQDSLDVTNMVSAINNMYIGILIQPFLAFSISLIIMRQLVLLFGGQPFEVVKVASKFV